MRVAESQGVAGAAVIGRVARTSGAPVSAVVTLVNFATGARRDARSDESGRFLFEAVPPGGPYRASVHLPGRPAPDTSRRFTLTLGERFMTTIIVGDAPVALAPVVISARTADSDPGGAGGPAFALTHDLVHGLPLFNRDFVGLLGSIPQSVGRTISSVGGQLPSLNAIQIDGGTANDVYGVNRTPGSGAGAKSISIEALDQIKVLVAPFDVRQAMFSGALINGVTRSGTNEWKVDAFTSMRRASLVGRDTTGARAEPFELLQYGATVSGPIVRDRLHLFAVADLQQSRAPYLGPSVDDSSTGVSAATAARAVEIFRTVYGFDAGTANAPTLHKPDRSLFGKLSWTIAPNHFAELWHQESRANIDTLNRDARSRVNRDGWQLSRSGYRVGTAFGTSRLRVVSRFGPATNELIAGDLSSSDNTTSGLGVPLFIVQADVPGTYLAGGTERMAQGTSLTERSREVTNNLAVAAGAHEVVVGAHAEWFSVADRFFPLSWGVWTFPSVDALAARAPTRYEIAVPLRDDGPIGRFHASEYSIYAQDRWTVRPSFTVTGGLRVDVPRTQSPATNQRLATTASLGNIDTGRFPSGNAVVSPRLSATWMADDRTRVRLGAGRFAGRPPYVWLGNAFMNTGIDQAQLVCTPATGVPEPVIDPARAPTRCLNSFGSAVAPSTVTYLDRSFRWPSARKLLAGIDRTVGGGLAASLDVISTTTTNARSITDTNLRRVGTNAEGRALYGTIGATGSAGPARRDSSSFTQVLRVGSSGGSRSISVALGLDGRWTRSALHVGYQWSQTRDDATFLNTLASVALQNAPIDGSLEERRLTPSVLDVPHALTAVGLVALPGAMEVSATLRAQSGRPFSFVALGDANADGVAGNDLAYVPRSIGDISLTNPELYPALDRYIEAEPCLRAQRGRIASRNSCRNPAFATLDARVTKRFSVVGTPRATLTADVFNLPNLLNRSWGLVRETTGRQQLELLQVAGWDAGAQRPRYAVPATSAGMPVLPPLRRIVIDQSRWQIQTGLRLAL